MNYYSKNDDYIKSVIKLLGGGFTNIDKVSFGVDYSQNRKISVVTIQLSPTPIIHSLIYFYTRGLSLYDIVAYKNKRYFKVSRGTQEFKQVETLNRFLLKVIPKINPFASRGLDEDLDSSLQAKDFQIKHLKDRSEIDRATIRSLRNQIESLKKK